MATCLVFPVKEMLPHTMIHDLRSIPTDDKTVFQQEENLSHISWHIPYFSDVLVILQMHDPYKGNSIGKGN